MPITRADIEARLVRSNKGLMELADLPTDSGGTNPVLGDVLADAMTRLGLALATPPNVLDADLAVVATSRYPHLYAVANVLLLEAILGSIAALPTEQANAQRVEWGLISSQVRNAIKEKWKEIKDVFPAGLPGRPVSGPLQCKPYPPDAYLESFYS